MALLDGLDDIDWSRLHHAYGPASDVPDLLRALVDPASASPALRKAADAHRHEVDYHVRWALHGNLVHQGSVWQASAPAVRFFAEILRDGPRDPALRRFVVEYLSHLAMASPMSFPARFDPAEAFAIVDGLDDDGGPPDYRDPHSAAVWRRNSYRAVEAVLDDVLPLLDDVDSEVACAAVALAAWFPDQAHRTAALVERVTASPDRQRAATAVAALARLAPERAIAVGRDMLHDTDVMCALHAACALVIAGGEIDDRALAILTAPLGERADAASALSYTVGALVGSCLALLPAGHIDAAVGAIARQLVDAAPLSGLALASSLLRLVFGDDDAPATAAGLTTAQRRALEALRDHGVWRIRGGIFSNFANTLHARGLPDSVERLTAWLAA